MADNATKRYIHKQVQKALFPDDSFLNLSINVGQPDAKSIFIPQELDLDRAVLGALNVSTFDSANHLTGAVEGTPEIVADDELEYATTIIRIPEPLVQENLQERIATYDRAAALSDQIKRVLAKGTADYVLGQWQPTLAARVFPTTGLDKSGTEQKRTASTGVKGAYTGLVKKFQYADLVKLSEEAMKMNVASIGGTWVCLTTVEMWSDIKEIDQVTVYNETGVVNQFAAKTVGNFRGINFLLPRQNDDWNANILYDITTPSAPIPVAYEATLTTDMNSALICWNTKLVERNEGSLKIFKNIDDALWMGTVTNAGHRVGGSFRRLDEKGVIAFYEAPTI